MLTSPGQQNILNTISMSTSFNMVPLEVNEMIALNIGNDKDLANFRLICRQTKHAIDGNNGSFWRKRFHQGYDAKAPIVSNSRTLVNNNYRIMYQRRRHYLKHGCTFDRAGITSTELRCLDILRDLIIGELVFLTLAGQNLSH